MFLLAMSFCVLIYAQNTPQMQPSVLDFVQLPIEQLGEIELYNDKQFVTSVAQLDINRIGQHDTEISLLKDVFYGTEVQYEIELNIDENWKVFSFYINKNIMVADEAESAFNALFAEKKMQNIYVVRLHFRDTPFNIKGEIYIDAKE